MIRGAKDGPAGGPHERAICGGSVPDVAALIRATLASTCQRSPQFSAVRHSYLRRRRIFFPVRRDPTLPSRLALAATRFRY